MTHETTAYIRMVMWWIYYNLLEYKTKIPRHFFFVIYAPRIEEENNITHEILEFRTSTDILLLNCGSPVYTSR